MHVNKIFYGLFVCAALCACSNEEVSEIIKEDTPKVFSVNEAYISVRLSDAGSIQSRATTPDPGYEYGIADEHAVQNAYFYFYDANGVFVSEGSAWNGGNAVDETNIEFKSNTVVVLKGLSKKNYPKYMVTVLNRPSSFSAPSSIQEMERVLADKSSVGILDANNNFVMSTTSWANQKNSEGENMKYFVTEVRDENFSLEPINDTKSSNYVTATVERLAAKVTLKIDDNRLHPVTISGKDGNYYQVKATVAGEGNSNNTDADGNKIAAEDLYVKFLGWKLNATAKRSNIVKNINEDWTDQELGFVWNKPSDYRSFWGKSFNYGKTDYTYPVTAAGYDSNNPNYPLDYVNLNNPLPIEAPSYCAENTNTSAIVSANFPSAVTSILLKAELCDANGDALDLVRFNGVLFKKTSFVEYILNAMKAKNKWNVWIETTAVGATDKTYKQIGPEYVQLVNVSDGKVKVELKEDAIAATLYSRAETTEEGKTKYSYSEIADKSPINNDLATESTDAVGYAGGLMYYNIPIEHLNNADNIVTDKVTIPEAKYGVVRNHHYVVTIDRLENIGKGIFNPDEVIVPSGDDNDMKAYYVGANINILSWKIVNQTVGI